MKKVIYLSMLGAALVQLHGCAAVAVGAVATGASMATDRRTTGVYVSDQEIELRAMTKLDEDFKQDTVHVSVTSYNQQLLLTGQVPDEATRNRLTKVMGGVPEVRKVFNETAVSGVASLTSEGNDAAITTQVKSRMLQDDRVPVTKIKVVTETSVVYLMGLVTQAEGKAAADVASTTGGATKVVKLFEYIN